MNTTLQSGASTASGSNAGEQFLVFRVRLHPQGNKESNKDFTFFQVCFPIILMQILIFLVF